MKLSNYKFDLTKEDVDVVVAALGEIPLKVSGPIFDKLRVQFTAQEQKAVAEAGGTSTTELLTEGE